MPYIGGIEQYTHDLAEALEKLGCNVIIITSNTFDFEPKEELSDHITIYRLPVFPVLNGRFPIPRKNQQYRELMEDLAAIDFDGILINTRFYFHTLNALDFAQSVGVTPLVMDHGSKHLTFGNDALDVFVKLHEHGITQRVKKAHPHFYGVSESSSQWLSHFGIESEGELSNAINPDFMSISSGRDFRGELGIPEDAFVVTFAGRLIPEKGIVPLVEAMEYLKDQEDIHFIIIGDGVLRPKVEAVTSKQVHYVGYQDRSNIVAALLQSDVFCLPTRSEGFCTSLLETAACGTTPIITRVGGVAELMPDSSYGIVLPDSEVASIVAAIEFLRDNPEINAQMAQNIQKRTQANFAWKNTAEDLLRAVEKAKNVENKNA